MPETTDSSEPLKSVRGGGKVGGGGKCACTLSAGLQQQLWTTKIVHINTVDMGFLLYILGTHKLSCHACYRNKVLKQLVTGNCSGVEMLVTGQTDAKLLASNLTFVWLSYSFLFRTSARRQKSWSSAIL